MKRLAFLFLVAAAGSLLSCGKKQTNADRAAEEANRIADSLAAVKAVEAAEAAAAADTLVIDEEGFVVE